MYENLYRITLLSSEGEQWLIQKLIVDVDDGASSSRCQCQKYEMSKELEKVLIVQTQSGKI